MARKKYHVIYNGQEYEVRWAKKADTPIDKLVCCRYDYMCIYKVKKKIFKIRIPVFRRREDQIAAYIENKKQTPYFYIAEIKELFSMYKYELNKKEMKRNQEKSLAEWDGIIE